MNKKYIVGILLVVCMIVSGVLHFAHYNDAPMCLNADEAAFGYNSFSILKTGRDEYGSFLPLRLKSFNDYKLPMYSYLSMPIVGVLGLSDFSIRLLNRILGVLLVPLVFLLTRRLFKNDVIALISAGLISVSPWILFLSRHAHEGLLSAMFVLSGMYFLLKYEDSEKLRFVLLANLSLVLSSFSYHSGRIFLLFFVLYQAFYLIRKYLHDKSSNKMIVRWIVILIIAASIPFIVDFQYGATRVQSLAFFNRAGFQMTLDEYLRDGSSRIVDNKLTAAIRTVTYNYVEQISPEFLITQGDENLRFGFPGINNITPVIYVIFFVGLYFLFERKYEYRWLVLLLLAVSPLTNALTWQPASLNRSFFLIFPIVWVAAYGLCNLWLAIKGKLSRYIVFSMFIGGFILFTVSSLSVYFNSYPTRAVSIIAWQCGYTELTDYIKERYNDVDNIYITKKNGQPYIYLLTYLSIDPEKFQNSVKRSAINEYGFTEVESFDKYTFSFNSDISQPKSLIVGYPDDFNGLDISKEDLDVIKVGNEEMFWIVYNR